MNIINNYLIIINIISFSLMSADKILAIYRKKRISELSLLITSFIGGSIGIITAMIIFRHKIRKIKFLIIISLNLLLTLYIYIKIPLI